MNKIIDDLSSWLYYFDTKTDGVDETFGLVNVP